MAADRPSTFTPLLRRFGSERDRELREARGLYQSVAPLHRAEQETIVTLGRRVIRSLDMPSALADPIIGVLYELLTAEEAIWELPEPDFSSMNMAEFVEYRNFLHAKRYFIANRDRQLAALEDGSRRALAGILSEVPATGEPTPFTIPLIYALAAPKRVVNAIWDILVPYHKIYLFRPVTEQLWRNICRASGRDPDAESRKPIIFPRESMLPVETFVNAYLAGTPFRELFLAPVPLRLTHEDRFNHWHVLAGSGQGKTVLIENVIRHDLAADDPPSLVLIDPHSDLVRKLVRSDLGIEDRLIFIDPRDTEYPVALNPFAISRERFAKYDEATREQVTAGVLQTFGFLWSGLTNLTLTGKQDVFFRYVTRLMLTLPEVEGRNATVLDMLKLMRDPMPYANAIAALPDIPREFFARDFMSKSFEGTKEQVRYRLQAIIESPTMARLFTAPETKVDLFTEMNRGAVILVDTAKDFLKEGSAIFGKLILSLILQAILERAAIPEAKRKPTFLMVDEAGSYFSSNIDDLLTEARKYKCGLLLAHQYLDQASPSLRASLAANAGIKFASGLSAQDAATMARDMRTTADMILTQPRLQFAAHVRNATPSAVSIPVKPAANPAMLSDQDFAALIERNRARVSLGHAKAPTPISPTQPHRDPNNEDISPTW